MQPEASCTWAVPVLAALGVPVGALYVICRHKGPSRPPMKEKRPLSVAELHQHTALLKCAPHDMLLTQSVLHCEHIVCMLRSLSRQGPTWCKETMERKRGHLSSQKVYSSLLWPYRARKMRSPSPACFSRSCMRCHRTASVVPAAALPSVLLHELPASHMTSD